LTARSGSIASRLTHEDGALDLGSQRTLVRDAAG
jgi:hypothetical protein